jgi:alginate O-acetyltransferase complex protein AlgJ
MDLSSSLLSEGHLSYGSIINVNLPEAGTISVDQSAVVGHDSWLFLYQGSNDYYSHYFDADQSLLADQWIRLIGGRERCLNERNIQYIHVIIPNKASVLPEMYPFALPRNQTDILDRILHSGKHRILCPLLEWRDSPVAMSVFRRNDSHLTLSGNAWLAELILSFASLAMPAVARVNHSMIEHVGDLGIKFNPGIPELFQAPSFISGLLDQNCCEKIQEHIPSSGLNGIAQSFRNQKPVYDKKIIIFGNSFFEKCPSWGLTPFFASLFEQCYFVWSAAVDYGMVDRVRPDIVITQTCERFLCRVPVD